jgi:hypothetical protein
LSDQLFQTGIYLPTFPNVQKSIAVFLEYPPTENWVAQQGSSLVLHLLLITAAGSIRVQVKRRSATLMQILLSSVKENINVFDPQR